MKIFNMKLGSIQYLIKEGFKGAWANRLMSLASIGVLVACMVVIGLAMLISENVSLAVGTLEKQNVIMLKSLDKILSICLKESAYNDFMLFVFIKEKINIDLIKDIIIFSNKYQFNNCNSFFNILLSKLIN